MSVLRTVERGEKIDDLMNELKGLTFTTGNDHAIVKLANGQRVVVSGGQTGIDLGDDVTKVFVHTHPYNFPASGPSAADYEMLDRLGQSSSWILEHDNLIKFTRGG